MTLRPGATLGPYTIDAVDGQAMHVLAEILADTNPIHLDAAAARAAGLGDRPVNQGPANFGYVIDMLTRSAPGAHVAALDVRLLGNVLAGDQVVAQGQVTGIEASGDAVRVECEVWLDVTAGRRVLEGTAMLRVPAGS